MTVNCHLRTLLLFFFLFVCFALILSGISFFFFYYNFFFYFPSFFFPFRKHTFPSYHKQTGGFITPRSITPVLASVLNRFISSVSSFFPACSLLPLLYLLFLPPPFLSPTSSCFLPDASSLLTHAPLLFLPGSSVFPSFIHSHPSPSLFSRFFPFLFVHLFPSFLCLQTLHHFCFPSLRLRKFCQDKIC